MNKTMLAIAGTLSVSSLLLLDSAVKGTALLALAAVAATMLRRDSAATRHLVWLLAIVAMLAVPLLSALLPEWRVLPEWAGVSPEPIAAKPSLPSIAAPADAAVALPQNADRVQPDWPSATAYQPAAEPPEARPAPVAAEAAAEASVPTWDWIGALPLAWAIGSLLLILRLTAARWVLWNAQRRATLIGSATRTAKATDDPLLAALETVSRQLALRRPVTLLLHPHKTIPVVWGIVRCHLMLPAAARQWSGEQLRSVLLHELAHVRRRDTTAQLLAQIACALHWFNPLVWLAVWRLGVEGERACDDLVLASGVRPSAYAGHLLEIVADFSPARWMQSCGLAMARKSSLEGRLLAVLGKNLNRRRVSTALAALALAMTVGIVAPIAMLRAAEEPWNPPQSAHVGSSDFSTYCVHDGTNSAFVIAYRGDFSSATSSSQNPKSHTWHDTATLTLKTKDGKKEVAFHRDHTAPQKLTLAGRNYDLAQGRVFLVSHNGEAIRQLDMNPPAITTAEARSDLAKQIAALPPQTREQPAVTKPEGGQTNVEAAAGKLQPKDGHAQSLFKYWQANARVDGKIPGGLIGNLGEKMKRTISLNKDDSPANHDYAMRLAKLLPRFDATHDWTQSDAIGLLNDISTVDKYNIPICTTLDAIENDTIRSGEPLPAELADAPWGRPTPDGLRVAWLLEPRAKAYPLGMALKSRVLVHNSGKKTAIFCMTSWLQGGGNAHDAKGAVIPVAAIEWLPMVTRKTYRLAPGEYCETPAAGVGVGAKAEPKNWVEVRIGARIDTKPGAEVSFSPRAVDLFCGPVPKDAADFLGRIVAERVGRELPLPATAVERAQIIRRVTLDLFGNSPTPEEIAAFVADKTPAVAANLEKRLANRPGVAPFMGTLQPGDIQFRVLAPAPDAAKKPPKATVITPAEVLENLKKHDAIYEAGFSVSGTQDGMDLIDLHSGALVGVKRRWKFTYDNDRFGSTADAIEHEKTLGLKPIRTKTFVYWGHDLLGYYFEDTNFEVSREGKETEKGTAPLILLRKPDGDYRSKYDWLWACGRIFSRVLDKVIRVEEPKDGLLVVSALGSHPAWRNKGRWELEIDTTAAWMVRKAHYYANDYVGDKPDHLYTEMTNSGTLWSGPYCIPKKALINSAGPINNNVETARLMYISTQRLTFDPVVGKFDARLYGAVQQAVNYRDNKNPGLKLDDQRVSPPTFTEPNRFKPEPVQH
jgi:beta-lactamase regulating signal transducer with metallopeptidase domain